MECLAWPEAEQSIGLAQAEKGMRFLTSHVSPNPVAQFASQVMRPISIIRDIGTESRQCSAKFEMARGCTHQLAECRSHEFQKRDEGGDWVAGQTKDITIRRGAKKERFSRLKRDPPKINFRSEHA